MPPKALIKEEALARKRRKIVDAAELKKAKLQHAIDKKKGKLQNVADKKKAAISKAMRVKLDKLGPSE